MTTKEIQTISRSNTRETIYKRIPNDESNYITHYMYTQHTFQMPWFTPQTYFHQLEHIDSTRASKYITRQPIPFTVLITSVRRRLNFPRYSNHTHFTLSQISLPRSLSTYLSNSLCLFSLKIFSLVKNALARRSKEFAISDGLARCSCSRDSHAKTRYSPNASPVLSAGDGPDRRGPFTSAAEARYSASIGTQKRI